MAYDDDPRAYLETEARLIAENETHAVLAVRIDKAMIRRNMLLLSALLDLCIDTRAKCPTR
jgi:hypothetical protein